MVEQLTAPLFHDWQSDSPAGNIATVGESSAVLRTAPNVLGFVSLRALPMNAVTRILSAIDQGNAHAAEQLLPLVYDELRQLGQGPRPAQTSRLRASVSCV